MRLKTIKFITSAALVISSFLTGQSCVCLAQGTAAPAQAVESGVSLEQALKNVEAQKAKERKALALKYSDQLNLVLANWLFQREALKKSQLNAAIEQDWDKLSDRYFSSVHSEYYLKGFNYSILSSEIKETESLTAPIKAQVVIREKIYAEQYHNPDISNIDPYCFTVISSITLNMEYRQDNFVITGTDIKMLSKNNNDYPEELKKLRF